MQQRVRCRMHSVVGMIPSVIRQTSFLSDSLVGKLQGTLHILDCASLRANHSGLEVAVEVDNLLQFVVGKSCNHVMKCRYHRFQKFISQIYLIVFDTSCMVNTH
jgi:hypothetical protein